MSEVRNCNGQQNTLVYGLLVVGLVASCLVAFLGTPYWASVAILLLINVIIVSGYRLITTMGGWSFVHVAFVGVGAYTLAILTTGANAMPFWIGLLAGPCVAALLALLISYPVLRTREYNFFLSTFAVAVAIQQCLIQFSSLTGGTSGIAFIPRPSLLFFAPGSSASIFVLVAISTAAVVTFCILFDRSTYGANVRAVAANEALSRSLGINVWRYRTLAFVLGTTVAGFGGVLLAGFNGVVNPSDFSAAFMFKVVAAAIVGGTTSIIGPILGLLYLTFVEELFRNASQYIPLIWGCSIIAVLLISGKGLEGLILRTDRAAAANTGHV